MQNQAGLIRIKRKTFFYVVFTILTLGIVTPVLAAYLGPNRTVTETTSACKVILYECRYVESKDEYRYKRVDNWACASESDPWEEHSSGGDPTGCHSGTVGDQYWEKEQTTQEVTNTYPPAMISGSLQNCTLQNGWCTTAPQFSLSGTEPVSGFRIIALEGSLNGENFACANSTCSVPLNEGNNNLTYWALSSWGDSSTMGTLSTKVDTQQPTISGTFSGTTGSNGWYLSPVSFIGTASDATSGLASFTCTLDGTSLGSCNSVTVNNEGAHTLALTARDNAGNTRTVTQTTSLDTQNPILNASLSGTMGSNNWYTNAEMNASASDPSPGSGLSTFEYNLDNSSWVSFPGSGALTLPEGKHSIDVLARDNAGRIVSSSKSFWLDSVPPNVNLDQTGTLGANNWYTTKLNLIASTSDATSGMDVLEYSLNSSAWTTYSAPLTIIDGSHNISFWAQDAAGLVTQVDRTYKVDTQTPKIAGSLSGIPGMNGWYISDVALSASASDPAPGSGLDAFTYILNSGKETSYTDALVLPDGEHTVQLNAQDKAGLTYSLEQKVKVDTIHPTLNVQTTLPNWSKDAITLTGTSGDNGSGLSKVEISTNGGQTWQPVIGTASWSYIWETVNILNGIYEVHVRTTDHAGLTTEHTFNAGVDNHGPKISVPDSWYQWDAITLDVWDNHSGLSEVRVEISDPEGRWPTRKINLDPERFPLEFKWDRRFGDDTVAPLGTYGVKVVAFDHLGNLTRTNASINILLGILPAGPVATAQPYVRIESTPAPGYAATPIVSSMITQAPVTSAFGSTPEPNAQAISIPEVVPTPRTAPTQTDVFDWLQSIFVPDVNGEIAGETVTEIGLEENADSIPQAATSGSNVLWGASAAAMIGAVTAYALEERRKQQEEAAKPAMLEARKEERHEKIQERKMEKLEAKWAQERAWEEARLEAEGREQYQASERSWSLPIAQPKISSLETEEEAWLEKKTQADKQPKPKEDLQAGLAAYYAAMREGEKESSNSQTNWWENTKSFVNESIIQPYIKPAMERTEQFVISEGAWINENLYQPHIKPVVENTKQFIINESAWINEHIYQPYVKPAVERTKEFINSETAWINEKIYQPHVKPVVEKTKQFVNSEVTWMDEHIYQPYVKPVVNAIKENPYVQTAVSVVNEKIYEPYFKPVVDDVSTWAENTWDKYGEWVHGALDTAGFIPGLGEIADGINGLIYLGEGRYLDATLTFASMIPFADGFTKATKWSLKAGQEILETAAEKITNVVAETVVTKFAKESLDDVAEIALEELGEELVEKTVKETGKELIEKVSQTAAERTVKEGTEQLANQLAKESVEEIAEKTVKETSEELVEDVSQTVAEKATNEIADEVPTTVVDDTVAPVIPAQKASKTPAEEKIEEILGLVDEETAQLINNLQVKYGDEMVGRFLPLCEKYGINPHDIITRPPSEGQSLIGWVLGIENPSNPVNHALVNMDLTQTQLDTVLEKSIVRPDSKVVVLGYGKGVPKPYYELSKEIKGCHLSLSSETWAPFETAKANFWTDINTPFVEKAIENRKMFLFNISYDEIIDPVNVDRFSLPELRLIELEINNYAKVPVGDYTAYVPVELLDTYEQYLDASLLV